MKTGRLLLSGGHFLFFQDLDKPRKMMLCIVRSRSRLWMILHAEDRQALVPNAGDRSVVQVHVRDLNVRSQRIRIDRESVVVRCDLHLAGREVFDRLISSPVSEL